MRESVGEPVLSFFACWGMHVETLHVISTSLSALCLLVSPIQHLHQSQHLVFFSSCAQTILGQVCLYRKSEGTPTGLQEINGGVSCYVASRLSHCCVIKSNPWTLLCGCCKLLSLPAFKSHFQLSCFFCLTLSLFEPFFSACRHVRHSFLCRFSQHSTLQSIWWIVKSLTALLPPPPFSAE